MTPNKLPPLPKHASKGPWPGDPAFYTADQMHAYAAEAIRQSQSLPAGAVAGLAAQLRQMACWCKSSEDDDGTGTFIPAYASGDVFDILTQAALQADAREKGEIADLESDIDTLAEHNVALQSVILDAIKIHSSFGTTADMADWLRDALDAAATQPAQASEKDNG